MSPTTAPTVTSQPAQHAGDLDADATTSWLAAYALGIAYARPDADDFPPDLAVLAGHRASTLSAARARLTRLDITDQATRTRARRLLATAERHTSNPNTNR
jgi:hypothetical protein